MSSLVKDNQFEQQLHAYYKAMNKRGNSAAAYVDQYNSLVAMQKADVPLTYSTSTTWFDPVYLNSVTLDGLSRSNRVTGALTKTTYQQQGDSYQTIATDSHTGLNNILESGALFSNTSVPALTDVDSIYPAILKLDWTNTEVAAALSGIQKSKATPNLTQIRDYMTKKFWDALEMQLCGVYVDFAAGHAGVTEGYGCDAPPVDNSATTFECVDRMISSAADSGATTYTSAATDGDIYWNSTGTAGTIRFDRSAGAGAANLRLPTGGTAVAGEAYNICDELDDLMTQCLVYDDNEVHDYIALMSPKAYNKIKAENDPKALITDYTDASRTVNGVSSTPGVVGGKVQLSALRLSDITVPIVTAPYLMGTASSSWLWKTTVHTTGGPGHIFLVNQNALEFRTLIPMTYRLVKAESALEDKHTLYMAGQLINKNWKSHGALKYIAT